MSAQPTAEGTLPSDLGGVQVLINGQAAPLLYVQSQQINAFAPFTLTPYTTAKISVAYNGATIGSTSVTVALQQGAVFRLSDTSTQAVAINQDGTLNGPAHPAPVGSVIAVYGTGFGQTQLPGVSGTLFPDTASSFASIIPAASIDSLPANVEYAGAAPLQWAGIDQINVQIPAGVPSGEASLYLDSWVMSFNVVCYVLGTVDASQPVLTCPRAPQHRLRQRTRRSGFSDSGSRGPDSSTG